MKKHIVLFLLLFVNFVDLNAQILDTNKIGPSVKMEIIKLSARIDNLSRTLRDIEKSNSANGYKIEGLNKQMLNSASQINNLVDSLESTQKLFNTESGNTHKKIEVVSNSLSEKVTLIILIIFLGLIITIALFVFLRKSVRKSQIHFIDQISKTRLALETETIKLDSKLVDILKNQLSISKHERALESEKTNKIDHKLPLKVGEEIHRMRKRIENMPSDIKGLSALNNSLQRLEEEFNENGYEIEKLEGKKYVDGMKVEARFVDNPDIPKGEEIITDVIRPAIKYNGILIQVAKVEVSKS